MIEMNPRVSRSSALASKATGFPIAKIAARLAVGYRLDEIDNDITGVTPACFEPTIDYVVVKWPRFAFEKFPGTDPTLSTHMRSVGEAMAIGRTFKQAFAKALRSRELDKQPSVSELTDDQLLESVAIPGPERFEVLLELLGREVELEAVQEATHDRPLVPARAARAGTRPRHGLRGGALVPLGGHLRGGVPRPHPLLLLRLGAPGGQRGQSRRAGVGRDPRGRPQPHRPGHRVRLLLRPRRHDGPRVRPRRGDDQLQPRDGLDRLRHLRPPVLRAADARGRARGGRAGAARWGWSSSSAARPR